jgi:hypothetical protein
MAPPASSRRDSLASVVEAVSHVSPPKKASVAFEAVNVIPLPLHTGANHGDSTTFASDELDEFYKPSARWEGLHRFDPSHVWEPSEEKRLVRKVSLVRKLSTSMSLTHTTADRLENMQLCLLDVLRLAA